MRVLGIDTSCDDTSVAIVDGPNILANIVVGQGALHKPFGGVVPEIAARAHAENMVAALQDACEQAGSVDAVAVTHRPGLIGPLLVGLSAAKTFALVHDLPLIGVHHIEAHVSAAYLLDPAPEPPFLALIASGGHTLLMDVRERGSYERIGETQDDAAGECFDKIATLLGLPYPGGPSIEKAALDGDAGAFQLPRPLRDKPGDDFSFSGLKTAVLYKVKGQDGRRRDESRVFSVADLAASAQEAIVDVLSHKAIRAARRLGRTRLVLGGGVAANTRLREITAERAEAAGIELFVPPKKLCTDNAAMIAVRGAELLAAGERADLALDANPYTE
ncbi:MAG: tRNA (adenosine(37)-N6)-threonylcarbamoyltransferase complex transferase subunit TsaD [Planctomycetota bacterium]